MNSLLIKSPEQLEQLGFQAQPISTLENTEQHLHWADVLEKWIQRLPGLRTPRNPDGTGGTPPKEHQLRHAAVSLCRPQNFLSWTMGVGKTLTSLLLILGWYGDHLFENFDWEDYYEATPEARKKLLRAAMHACKLRPGAIQIVAPRHVLRQVWMKEMERIGLADFAEVIETESQLVNSSAPIFIYDFNFPKLQSAKGAAMRKAGQGIRIKSTGKTYFLGRPLAKIIAKRRRPSFLIVDEIHKLKEGTERTRAMQIVRRKAKRVIGLTGTPMDGWVDDAATILGFIYGEESRAYPFDNSHFASKFTSRKIIKTDIITGGETVGKERPVPGLNQMQIPSFIKSTRHLMHRLNLQDPEVKANVVYPPVKEHQVLVEMDPLQQEFYDRLHREDILQMQNELLSGHTHVLMRRNIFALMNNLRMASSAPWAIGYPETLSTNLVDTVIKIVESHKREGRKGLIGTTFIQESRLIHEALQKAGLKGVRIHAGDPDAGQSTMPTSRREELIEQFQEDPECWYLISNKELVAEGLNLAETASYTVSCSNSWRANIESQWLSRVVRPGQSWPHVDAYTLLNRGTIHMYIFEMVQAKIAATRGMIDLEFSYGEDTATAMIDVFQLADKLTTV